MESHTSKLLILVCSLTLVAQHGTPQATPNGVDVLTHRYDTWRTGANLSETVLTTRNVAGLHFGRVADRKWMPIFSPSRWSRPAWWSPE